MAITLRNNMTKSTIYSYKWFIIYSSPLSAFLAPSQDSFPQVFLLQPLTIFQFFRPSGPPHIHSFICLKIFSAIYLTLACPSDHNLNVGSSERPILTDHSKLFCISFSLMVLQSLLPEPIIIYMRFFIYHFLPSADSSSYT